MRSSTALILALALSTAACADPPVGEEDGSVLDVDAGDAGPAPVEDGSVPLDAAPDVFSPDAEAPDASTPTSSVYFVEPLTIAYANSQLVPLRAVATGLVDRIDVFVDGVLLANLEPPYEWSLPTAALSVGPHVVTPKGIIGTTVIEGPPITLIIDRTPIPALTAMQFSPSALRPIRDPIVITFAEPLSPSAATSLTVTVSDTTASRTLAGTSVFEGSTITFTPDDRFIEGHTIRVTLAGTVRDRAENATPGAFMTSLPTRSYWAATPNVGRSFSATARNNRDFLFGGLASYNTSTGMGVLNVQGRIAGEAVTTPMLDATYTRSNFIDTGIDAHNVAYALFHEQTAGTERAYVVSRRDPATRVWTNQTLVAPDEAGGASAPSLIVAGNGHAFVRITVNGTPRTYYRAPGDAAFALTSAFDGIALSDNTPFPGTEGRVCEPSSLLVAPENTHRDHIVLCRGGGAPDASVVLERLPEGTSPLKDMRANELGDGLFTVGLNVYVFDGETETIAASTTFSMTSLIRGLAIGPAGHVCVGSLELDGSGNVLVQRRGTTGAFSAPEVAGVEPSWPSFPGFAIAADGAGNCFVRVGTNVLHDATLEGNWAPPFSIGSGFSGLLAGAPDQAFAFRDSSGVTPYAFNPLTD